ncbi:MAG: type II secretion system protein GspE [Lachnospiraceae bacterium]|nr:type II secretion system protein GspE [Lachnospiraceae bacterium]
MPTFRKKIRLGDILIQRGLVTQEQLEQALEEQRRNDKSLMLGEIFVNLNIVTQEQIDSLLCEHLGIESADLRKVDFDEKIVHLINENIARRYCIIPFALDTEQANAVKVAMVDPMNYVAMDDISIITGMNVVPVLATRGQINSMIDRHYGKEQAIAMAEMYRKEQEAYEQDEEDTGRKEDIENSPIVLLVKGIIEQAVRERASDIHIEPFEYDVKVRFRVDGTLREIITYEKTLLAAIVARVKVLSGMDISEKRKPQDGRITIDIEHQEYDIRVSALPTVFGEKIVMRLASKSAFKKDKKDLGLRPEDMVLFDHILKNPHGIILVTGPTGSGKSTTLYTALNELSTEYVNIITVEDPVEANIEGVNQVQVNEKAGLTFANALRSILRQDPDIIMIGEIRDSETAEIAVKASITGHLVVSTLHTNSTASAVGRLTDMGVESYLLADSLVGIIAQRLVRRLCDSCKKPKKADYTDKKLLGLDENADVTIYEPCGCPLCGNTGYHNRVGIYEIMNMTPRVKRMVAINATSDEIQKVAEEEGMNTLRKSASKYVLEGVTSVNELIRATFEA